MHLWRISRSKDSDTYEKEKEKESGSGLLLSVDVEADIKLNKILTEKWRKKMKNQKLVCVQLFRMSKGKSVCSPVIWQMARTSSFVLAYPYIYIYIYLLHVNLSYCRHI